MHVLQLAPHINVHTVGERAAGRGSDLNADHNRRADCPRGYPDRARAGHALAGDRPVPVAFGRGGRDDPPGSVSVTVIGSLVAAVPVLLGVTIKVPLPPGANPPLCDLLTRKIRHADDGGRIDGGVVGAMECGCRHSSGIHYAADRIGGGHRHRQRDQRETRARR